MDYEDILFGLQPIINVESVKDIPLQSVYLESYLTVLDQLAVSLRAPNNREVVGKSGLLSNLCRVLEGALGMCFDVDDTVDKLPYFKLSNELIRCVANVLVDNDDNRSIFLEISDEYHKNMIVDYYVGRILKLTELPNHDDEQLLSAIQMRTIVLLRNLSLGNHAYTKRVESFVRGPLISLLRQNQHIFLEEPETVVLGSDLLNDFAELDPKYFTLLDILFFSESIYTISKTISDDIIINENEDSDHANEIEEDPSVDILFNFTQTLESIVTHDDNINLTGQEETINAIHKHLLNTLEILYPKEFQNKLIVMRRIVSISGYLSSNPTNTNILDRKMCINTIRNNKNGYVLAACLIVLSNSINSREDVNQILQDFSLEQLIESAKNLKDPMQFQGFLDILKKLINMSNSMFLTKDTLNELFAILSVCQEQAKYFQNLAPLLNSLLDKLLTVLPSASLYSLITEETQSPLLNLAINAGCLTSCILLDKLLVSKNETPNDVIEKLWDNIFKYQNNQPATEGLSINTLFQLSKTIGVYLRKCDNSEMQENYLFTKHSNDLITILDTILSLRNKSDRGSESAINNGKFIAGMIINLCKRLEILTIDEQTLKERTNQFFM